MGANFGWYSCLFFRIAGSNGKAFLFEPEPTNADLLVRNLELNGARNCALFRAGAGSRNSKALLHKAHHSNPGAHTFVEGLYSEGDVEVPIVTLDQTILPVIGGARISLLKIDIEGFELEALRGGGEVLDRTDAMVLEFSPPFLERGGFAPSDLWAVFQGFDTYRFEHGSDPVPLSRMPEETCDLLLTRSGAYPRAKRSPA